ncbi:hypothetical protein BS78_01G114100, partial [Paspalum vaginatum]
PCNPICVLCDQQPETASYLCLHCPFALEVWDFLRQWIGGNLPPSQYCQSVGDWCELCLINKSKDQKRNLVAFFIFLGIFGRRRIDAFSTEKPTLRYLCSILPRMRRCSGRMVLVGS